MPQTAQGLSPRVRGNPVPVRLLTQREGSIPTCAGEPSCGAPIRGPAPVYPHVCGGTKVEDLTAVVCVGLSPRVRGNHAPRVGLLGQAGSIPTCAGEPRSPPAAPAWRAVYPHVCGGTDGGCDRLGDRPGLSPRVRGNHGVGCARVLGTGSIPTCAGEPRRTAGRRGWTRVYPRVYGGTVEAKSTTQAEYGLSPRVRGNRVFTHLDDGHAGSIPACTGEPWATWPGPTQTPVYPRVYGGTLPGCTP